MCGIVGYVGSREASDVLIAALKRLEYRGYDSAGVAALDGRGIEVRRCVGKLGNLERLLPGSIRLFRGEIDFRAVFHEQLYGIGPVPEDGEIQRR